MAREANNQARFTKDEVVAHEALFGLAYNPYQTQGTFEF